MSKANEEIPYLSVIPDEVLDAVQDKRVAVVSFGAGPACIGGMHEEFDVPAELEAALRWFAPYMSSLRKAHVSFTDGSGIWFDGDRFWRFDPDPHTPPRAGVIVHHPAEAPE